MKYGGGEEMYHGIVSNLKHSPDTSLFFNHHLKNSEALVRERTIPNDRQLLVGEVSANYRG
jgi:lysozyme family protein